MSVRGTTFGSAARAASSCSCRSILSDALERSDSAGPSVRHRGNRDRRSLGQWILGHHSRSASELTGWLNDTNLRGFRRAPQRTRWPSRPLGEALPAPLGGRSAQTADCGLRPPKESPGWIRRRSNGIEIECRRRPSISAVSQTARRMRRQTAVAFRREARTWRLTTRLSVLRFQSACSSATARWRRS